VSQVAQPAPAARRFQFDIAANTPLKDLLPPPPKVHKPAGPLLTDDLAHVPEVEFQAAPTKEPAGEEAFKATAFTMAKINHLNGRKTDGFLSALRFERSDLAGLPFAMGDACRTKGERTRQFAAAVNLVRSALQQAPQAPAVNAPDMQNVAVSSGFWNQFQALCAQQDQQLSRVDHKLQEHVTLARIAALVQILAPEAPDMRLGLVKYLSGVAHAEATRSLARMALFSSEEEVRQAAVEALKVRRERDYTEVLVQGLRYPWPAIARRAADTAVKLERADLVPQFISLLDEPDPRAPVLKESEGKKVPVVREMVRLNHHKSCLMCHAPGNTDKVSPEAVTAPVPIPGQPFPTPSQGYGTVTTPDTLVRVDVTYLRPDFSMLEPVADANPWPEMQRFDFLVRTRTLTDDEAAAYRDKLEVREPGRPSPYQRVALTALRELTGKDAEPSAEAWRRLLDQSAKRE
jgi:hypothetical protein